MICRHRKRQNEAPAGIALASIANRYFPPLAAPCIVATTVLTVSASKQGITP
jgi:hypothetical protein